MNLSSADLQKLFDNIVLAIAMEYDGGLWMDHVGENEQDEMF